MKSCCAHAALYGIPNPISRTRMNVKKEDNTEMAGMIIQDPSLADKAWNRRHRYKIIRRSKND